MAALDIEELAGISPLFRGKAGRSFARFCMHVTAVDKVNDLYGRIERFEGPDFADAFFKDLGIDYSIGNAERLQSLPEGPFITISNHAYGHVDGVALIDIFGHADPSYKVMVNKILAHFKSLGPSFITVTPTGTERVAPTADSIGGIRLALAQIREGKPLGLFPSGAVSDLRKGVIRDREWQEAIIKFIRKAAVPVVPVRFFDRNSMFFYRLGLIDWKIRLIRLCWELFNKRGKTMRIGIGETIPAEKLKTFDDPDELRSFLRSSVYDMPLPDHWTKKSEL